MLNTEQTSKHLNSKLFQYHDPVTAIAVYKEAAGYIAALKKTQATARAVIVKHLADLGELEMTTPAGKASYTIPKKPRLDKTLWREAVARSLEARNAQNAANHAKSVLELTQEAAGCMILPAGSLRIT